MALLKKCIQKSHSKCLCSFKMSFLISDNILHQKALKSTTLNDFCQVWIFVWSVSQRWRGAAIPPATTWRQWRPCCSFVSFLDSSRKERFPKSCNDEDSKQVLFLMCWLFLKHLYEGVFSRNQTCQVCFSVGFKVKNECNFLHLSRTVLSLTLKRLKPVGKSFWLRQIWRDNKAGVLNENSVCLWHVRHVLCLTC